MWSANEQYAYGWAVPLLALGLLRKRWLMRPLPQLGVSPRWLGGLVAAFALILLPVRVIHEINQDWSFCSYLLSLLVIALSFYAVFLAGGWPWVRHFAFPICFILVAVNWPYRIENSLKYRLMNAVSSLTVEIIGWMGVPAVQHGNVIELAGCSVGVEDACSGIRSLQSTIMAAFFFGEFYLLRWPQRLLLLAAGAPLAFVFNVIRTLFLTWQGSVAGEAAIAKWHDTAGMTISLLCFAGLWLIAVIIKRKFGSPLDLQLRESHMARSPADSLPIRFGYEVTACGLARFRRYLFAVGLWSAFVIGVTEAWYRAHETDPAQVVRWSAQLPGAFASERELPISEEIRQILKCDQGNDFCWEEPDGSKWSAYFFRWRAGEATSRMAARDHRPEICLPSRGYEVEADFGIHLLPAHGLELPFRAYTFAEAGRALHVFFCLWEDGADKQTGLGRSKYLDRLDSVLAGRRRLGQQTLEIIVSGYASIEDAERALREQLSSMVLLGGAPSTLTLLGQEGKR